MNSKKRPDHRAERVKYLHVIFFKNGFQDEIKIKMVVTRTIG